MAPQNDPFPDSTALLTAMPEPTLVVDKRLFIRAGNAAARALLGEFAAETPLSLVLRHPELLDTCAASLANGTAQRIVFSWRDRIERAMEAHVAPVGQDRFLLISLRDMTETMRLERMRVDFVANASHELRTPLASMLGFIDTLLGPARDDAKARQDFLSIMRQQGRRMARLIDDLLSLSRVELNQHLRPTHEVALVPLIGHLIETLSPLARERDCQVVLNDSQGPTRMTVIGDRDELLRVFENLIENAIKYGGSGGLVDILIEEGPRLADAARSIQVTVRDYGPGIAPEHLPRLTERFYRVDVAGSRAQGGTGLGLALVKHILARHRGRLEIESMPGAGASFKAILPMASADQA